MSRTPRKDRRLVKVLAAIRSHGGPGHSPLYRWMRQHHDSLAAAFVETPAAWGPLATELGTIGLTDADGKPPTTASARQTWYRVRRDIARAREVVAAQVPVLASDEIAPAVHVIAPPATPDRTRDSAALPRPRMALSIQPARTATGDAPVAVGPANANETATTRAARATEAPAVATPNPAPGIPTSETAAEQLERLLGSMAARKVPLPKIM